MDCIYNPENDVKFSIGQNGYYIYNRNSPDRTKQNPSKLSLARYGGEYEYLCGKYPYKN